MDDFTVTPGAGFSDDSIGGNDPDNATPFISADAAPYRCEVCSTPLVYSGRGRPPTRCDEHRKSKGTQANRNTATGNLRTLELALSDMYRGLGFAVGMVDQFDGMAVASGADQMAHSWIVLAQTDKNVRKFLERITTGSGWGAVILAHALVAMPIIQHHNLLPERKAATDA